MAPTRPPIAYRARRATSRGTGAGTDTAARRGRLLVGTSGFAYPDWSPRFYPPGLKGDALLPHYASRLPAVELNNTFYARPTPAKIDSWVRQTPPEFRFVIKGQRGGSMRALLMTPEESVPWLTEHLDRFGERLGAVLFRVPDNVRRKPDGTSDGMLRRVLAAWPASVPFVLEVQHESWHVDETFEILEARGATLCATDQPDQEAPTIRATGPFLYLRLRREDYGPAAIATWANRITPFLDSGRDVYAFFRHDEVGRGAELALELRAAVDAARA